MAEMSVRQEDSTLVTQCLDFCQQLASHGKSFSISLKLGSNFSFSLDTMEKITTENVVKKNKLSPSSIRRNARRRQEFLEKKRQINPVRSAPAANGNKENTSKNSIESTGDKSFKCDNCDLEFETEKGLRCHEGKKHKLTLSPIPQTDGHTEECEVTIPLNPAEVDSLGKPLWLPLDKKYAHPPASVIHPVMGRGIYHDTSADGTFCYKFSNGELWEA